MYPKQQNWMWRTREDQGVEYRLVLRIESVEKILGGYNRALSDEGRTVDIVGMLLE